MNLLSCNYKKLSNVTESILLGNKTGIYEWKSAGIAYCEVRSSHSQGLLSALKLEDQLYERPNNENSRDNFHISHWTCPPTHLKVCTHQWYLCTHTTDSENKTSGPSARIPREWKFDWNIHFDVRIQLFFYLLDYGSKYICISTLWFLGKFGQTLIFILYSWSFFRLGIMEELGIFCPPTPLCWWIFIIDLKITWQGHKSSQASITKINVESGCRKALSTKNKEDI